MRSLGSRLTCWYALVVMCTVIVTMLIGYWLLRRELIHGVDLLNAAEFREIRNRVEFEQQSIKEDDFIRRVAEHAEIDAPLYFFQVRKPGGEILFRSPNMGGTVLEANPGGKTNWTSATSGLGLIRTGRFREGPFQVQIATSLRNIRQFSYYYLQVGLVVSGVALVVSIFFGHRLSRLALDPIRRIQQTAERISADNLGTRIPVDRSGNDEIAGLAHLLNQMFNRLETSFERLSRFAGDASHELKTPLSLVRLQSEKLLLHGNLPAGQEEIIQQQLESINRLNSVIERLLFLAKSEVGAIRPSARRQDTAEFIEQFFEDAQVLCEDQQVTFAVIRNERLLPEFDATLLRQVLLNLVSNALRVTPSGQQITLCSWGEAGRWMVAMEDTGPGLPSTQLEQIFEPFTRIHQLTEHGRAEHRGAGLGLTICRTVIEVHRGIIYAENRDPGPGLRVCFELPISSSRSDKPANLNGQWPALSLPVAAVETHPGKPRAQGALPEVKSVVPTRDHRRE